MFNVVKDVEQRVRDNLQLQSLCRIFPNLGSSREHNLDRSNREADSIPSAFVGSIYQYLDSRHSMIESVR